MHERRRRGAPATSRSAGTALSAWLHAAVGMQAMPGPSRKETAVGFGPHHRSATCTHTAVRPSDSVGKPSHALVQARQTSPTYKHHAQAEHAPHVQTPQTEHLARAIATRSWAMSIPAIDTRYCRLSHVTVLAHQHNNTLPRPLTLASSRRREPHLQSPLQVVAVNYNDKRR